jgi:divalent metal cation (Fe/Co/Zn/Cd) transporter
MVQRFYARTVNRGWNLEYLTCIETGIAATAGILAGSLAMIGFGADSLIEVVSGGALLWRMSVDHDDPARRYRERVAMRIVNWCFVALAIYVVVESVIHLIYRHKPETSTSGILLASASMVVMPWLAAHKKMVSKDLKSDAMRADARQTTFGVYLSFLLLIVLAVNAPLGWWWADAEIGLAWQH